MIATAKLVSGTDAFAGNEAVLAEILVTPPVFAMLPRRAPTNSVACSMALHALAVTSALWLPVLFPRPIVLDASNTFNVERPSAQPPLIMPVLLPPVSAGPAVSESAKNISSKLRAAAAAVPLPQRDYAGPQLIVSNIAGATNRVQSILRPDLQAPPDLKFPVRLQSMVMLPATRIPVLNPAMHAEPGTRPVTPIDARHVEVPIAETTVPPLEPVSIVKLPEQAPVNASPAQTSVPDVVARAESQVDSPKAVIVVNALNITQDPPAKVPDAQLAGSFVVGPTPGKSGADKMQAVVPAGSAIAAPTMNEAGPQVIKDNAARTGNNVIAKAGLNSSHGTPAGSNGIKARANTSGTPGLSISGGVTDLGGNTIKRTGMPGYGMTITASGNSGGASRDMGVFDRRDTVYSVSIPMEDAGGGPDWPMQYALMREERIGAGLLVPPLAQKKVAAIALKSDLMADAGLSFIYGVIDEKGKLQSLRSVYGPEARSQVAMRALRQWEFLPASIDGRPVASKVLIGVSVVAAHD
jgi:hypothetical protein